MKSINMSVKTTNKRNGAEITVTRKAELRAEELSFTRLAIFLQEVEKINSLLRSAIKNGAFVEFEVHTYSYALDGKGYFSGILHGTYNRWYYKGYPQDNHCDLDNGILAYHLQPDIKYSPATHDMVYDYNIASLTA